MTRAAQKEKGATSGSYSDTFFGFLLGVMGLGAQDPVSIGILIVLSFAAASATNSGSPPFGLDAKDVPPVVAAAVLVASFATSAALGGTTFGEIAGVSFTVYPTLQPITAGACLVAIAGHFGLSRGSVS